VTSLIAVALGLKPFPPAPTTHRIHNLRQPTVIKGKVPVSNEVLKVKLPKPQDVRLPNGLHLMVLADHRLPRVTFQIIIPGGGGYYDPPA
jgi:hypothetical protein